MVKVHDQRPEFTEEVVLKTVNLFEELCLKGGLESLIRCKMLVRFWFYLNLLGYLAAESFEEFFNGLLALAEKEKTEFFKVLLADFFIEFSSEFVGVKLKVLDLLRLERDLEVKSVVRVVGNQRLDFLGTYQLVLEGNLPVQEFRILKYCGKIEMPVFFGKIKLGELLQPAYLSDWSLDLLGLSSDLYYFLKESVEISDLIFVFRHNIDLLSSKLELKDPILLANTLLQQASSLITCKSEIITYSSLAVKLAKQNNSSTVLETKLFEGLNSLLSSPTPINSYSIDKLASFTSHFISNMSFNWPWASYTDKSGAFEVFLPKLLSKLVRLSYHDMMKSDLPDNLDKFLLPEPEPILRFAEIEESVDSTDSQLIIDRINSKASTQVMKSLLTSKEICNSGDLLMMIFCESLFYQGAKSLQHITIYIERYLEILTGIQASHILSSLFNVWQRSPQRIELLTGKLLTYKLVNCEEIVIYCVESLGKLENPDKAQVEWDLIELAVGDSKDLKFDLIEVISRELGKSKNTEKVLEFFRKYIKELNEAQVLSVTSYMKEDLAVEVKKLFYLMANS